MNLELRALLIHLFDQLSDNDRRALHFFVGNKVSRQSRDNCSPSGSLTLLDSLFDREIISDQNFDFLINLFEQINCQDVANQLQEYKLSSIHTSIAVPISSEVPYYETALSAEVDKIPNHALRQSSQLFSSSERSSVELEQPQFQPTTSSEEGYTLQEKDPKTMQATVGKLFSRKRYLLATISVSISILSALTLLIFFVIQFSKRDRSPFFTTAKQKLFFHSIKEGSVYGDVSLIQNESFDDAEDLQLTYVDQCIGVELQWSSSSLVSIRFLYSNKRLPISPSAINNTSSNSSQLSIGTFILSSNEEINKINLYLNVSRTKFHIVGIQFRTTTGRKSLLFGSNDGSLVTESFQYNTFGYARGQQQQQQGIRMLQFIWIKQSSSNERISAVSRSMLEVCEFFFISNRDYRTVHVKGIESSWYDLKRQFNRSGDECDRKASYYRLTSERGPSLFAIVNGDSVYYHEKNRWERYLSAKNITCDVVS